MLVNNTKFSCSKTAECVGPHSVKFVVSVAFQSVLISWISVECLVFYGHSTLDYSDRLLMENGKKIQVLPIKAYNAIFLEIILFTHSSRFLCI